MRDIRFITATCITLLVLALSNPGLAVSVGAPAPNFEVASGDDHVLTRGMVQGRTVVIFYETKDIVDGNKPLADELLKMFSEQSGEIQNAIVRLPVINCSNASVITRPLWKEGLRRHSKQRGFVIYGDWDGQMFSDWNMVDNESNFIIVDKTGTVRYFYAGKLPASKYGEVKKLLKELTQ